MDWLGCGDHDNGGHREYPWWLTQKTTDAFRLPGTFDPPYSHERSVRYPEGHRNIIFTRRGVRTLPRLPITAAENVIHAPDTAMAYKYLKLFDGVCASHTSSTSMGTDWRDNDPKVEPIVEIYQGDRMSYEKQEAPRAGYDPKSGKKPANIAGWFPAGFIKGALVGGLMPGRRHVYADTAKKEARMPNPLPIPRQYGTCKQAATTRSAARALTVLALMMGVATLWPRSAHADGPDPEATAVAYRDEPNLVTRLWAANPDVLEARAAVGAAAAELLRARSYPNPTLDAAWGTIPVGATTPKDLQDPLTNVPNYTFGLSELIEIAKRGPREAAAVHAYERAEENAQAKLAEKTFDLSIVVPVVMTGSSGGFDRDVGHGTEPRPIGLRLVLDGSCNVTLWMWMYATSSCSTRSPATRR
jgi:hypothetical protein